MESNSKCGVVGGSSREPPGEPICWATSQIQNQPVRVLSVANDLACYTFTALQAPLATQGVPRGAYFCAPRTLSLAETFVSRGIGVDENRSAILLVPTPRGNTKRFVAIQK